MDPRIRTTFWTIFVGYSMGLAGRSCTDQTMMQRFLSTKSINTARWYAKMLLQSFEAILWINPSPLVDKFAVNIIFSDEYECMTIKV